MIKSILYCEDDDCLREVFLEKLSLDFPNALIREARCYREAVKLSDEHIFDLVITDNEMDNREDGVKLYRYFRGQKKSSCLFVILSSIEPTEIEALVRDSSFIYVTKLSINKITQLISKKIKN